MGGGGDLIPGLISLVENRTAHNWGGGRLNVGFYQRFIILLTASNWTGNKICEDKLTSISACWLEILRWAYNEKTATKTTVFYATKEVNQWKLQKTQHSKNQNSKLIFNLPHSQPSLITFLTQVVKKMDSVIQRINHNTAVSHYPAGTSCSKAG